MAEEDHGGELVPVVEAAAAVELADLEKRARSFARDSRATSTWRAYDSDFADFRTWCANQVPPLEPPPAMPTTVAPYLTTLGRGAQALDDPATTGVDQRCSPGRRLRDTPGRRRVRAVWSGIRRRQSSPSHDAGGPHKVITAMVAPLGDNLADARDRTLLLFGFAGALRRNELVPARSPCAYPQDTSCSTRSSPASAPSPQRPDQASRPRHHRNPAHPRRHSGPRAAHLEESAHDDHPNTEKINSTRTPDSGQRAVAASRTRVDRWAPAGTSAVQGATAD